MINLKDMTELKQAHTKYIRNKLAMGPAFKDSGLVFSREDGSEYHPESLARMWRRFLDKHGLKSIRFLDLRHSCATALWILRPSRFALVMPILQ